MLRIEDGWERVVQRSFGRAIALGLEMVDLSLN